LKKLFFGVVLVCGGLIIGLPGAVGFVAERQHDQFVRELNVHGNQLAEENYERGWFSSRTRFRYRIEDERLRELAATVTQEPEGTPELLVDSEIYHGPVPALSGGFDRAALAWTDVDSSLSLRAPSGVEISLPGELQSRVEADGSTRFNYHAGAESRSIGNGLMLTWDDAEIDIALGRGKDSVSVNGNIGTIELTDTQVAMRVGPTVVKSTQERSKNELWAGDVLIRIGAVTTPELAANDLTLETRVRESSGQATYAIELKANNLQGAGFAGDNAHVDIFAQRLDAAALGRLIQLMSQYSDKGQIPSSQRDALLRQLIAAGPEINLRTFKIPMPDSDIEGDALISVSPGTGFTLAELARGAEGKARFLMPKEMIRQILQNGSPEVRNAIDTMMRFQILKSDGQRYRIEAEYAGGLLTVNGFPVPVPVF